MACEVLTSDLGQASRPSAPLSGTVPSAPLLLSATAEGALTTTSNPAGPLAANARPRSGLVAMNGFRAMLSASASLGGAFQTAARMASVLTESASPVAALIPASATSAPLLESDRPYTDGFCRDYDFVPVSATYLVTLVNLFPIRTFAGNRVKAFQ